MLRVGQAAPPSGGPPKAPPSGGGPPMPPDQIMPPDAPPQDSTQAGSGDHKQDLVEALTYMQMAMELIMNCLKKYQDEEGAEDAGQEPTDQAPPGGGGPPAPPLPGQ